LIGGNEVFSVMVVLLEGMLRAGLLIGLLSGLPRSLN
jgi:hypothetical protein